MALWILLSLLIGILVVFSRRGTLRYIYLTSKIQGPSLWEFVTVHAKDFLSDSMLQSVCQMCEKYSYQPWGFWTMKGDFMVVLSDPGSISLVYRDKNLSNKTDSFYGPVAEFLAKASLILNGETWKRHRKAINPAFRKTILERNLDILTDGAERVLEKIRDHADGSSINMNPILELVMIDTMIRFSASNKYAYPNVPRLVESLNNGLELVQLKLLNPVYYWVLERFNRAFRDKIFDVKFVVNDAKRVIVEATRSAANELNGRFDKDPGDLLECFLYFNGRSGNITDTSDYGHECFLVIVAAIETTSTAIKAALLMLALHQDLQERVLEELNGIFGSGKQRPTPQDLEKMEYLEMFIKETMRLFPPAAVFAREASEEANINGILIPKGSSVLILARSLHRNPEFFEEPLKFDPERFTPEKCATRDPYSYLPFSSGSRNCVGQVQAMVMMKIMLSTILREYKILPGEDLRSVDDVKVKLRFTMTVLRTVVKLVRRSEIC